MKLLANKQQLALFFFLFLLGSVYFFFLTPYVNWGDDYAMYVAHAQNIAEGKKYADTGYIPNPDRIICPEFYPPIFPLLMAPLYKIFGMNFVALKIVGVIAFLVFLFFVFGIIEEEFNGSFAWGTILFLGVNPFLFLFVTHFVLSDVPFLAFAFAYFFYAYKVLKNSDFTTRNLLALGFLAYLAYGTRTVGILLPLAFSGEVLLNFLRGKFSRKQTLKILSLLNGSFLVFVFLEKWLIGNETLHWKMLMNASKENFLIAISHYSKMFYYYLIWFDEEGTLPVVRPLKHLLKIGLLVGAFFGFIRKSRKNFGMFEFFVIGYGLMLLIWPGRQGMRFLFPFLPFLFIYFYYAVEIFREKLRKQIVFVFILLSLIMFGIRYVYQLPVHYEIPPGPFQKDVRETLKFLRSEVPDSSVIMSEYVRTIGLFTGKKVISWDYTKHPTREEFREFVRKYGVDYSVFHKNATEFHIWFLRNIEPLLRRDTAYWEKIYDKGNMTIYRRRK